MIGAIISQNGCLAVLFHSGYLFKALTEEITTKLGVVEDVGDFLIGFGHGRVCFG